MPRTAIINKDLNPTWCDDADVPALHLCVDNEADLQRCHLLLAVFDKVRARARARSLALFADAAPRTRHSPHRPPSLT